MSGLTPSPDPEFLSYELHNVRPDPEFLVCGFEGIWYGREIVNMRVNMNEDAVNLGALLRAKREERELTLREVENSTSIRSTYLQAIEEGNVNEMISGVYGIGFTRQYVQFLGMNVEAVAKEYQAAFHIPKEVQTFSYGLGTLEPRGSAADKGKMGLKVLWTVLSAGVLVLGYFVCKYYGVL